MAQSILKFENVSKTYGNLLALDGISFSVNQNEIVGLIGPNGAGKTTALKLIARLLIPNEGRILIKTRKGHLQDIRIHEKNLIEMGFLIDIPHFYNTNPASLLRLIAKIRNYPKDQIEDRMDTLLKSFNLYEWKYKKIKTFSKGMVQKLGFCTAIIHDPEVVILDEPQTGLDPQSRIIIREYLRNLKKEGKTIIISSHLLEEIREICDKIALINQGKLVGYDTIDNLEITYKTKELICEIEKPIALSDRKELLEKIEQLLYNYLEKENDDSIVKDAISYNSDKQCILIKYNGLNTAKSKILEILSQYLSNSLKITSFYEPKITQLERIYSKMINKEND